MSVCYVDKRYAENVIRNAVVDIADGYSSVGVRVHRLSDGINITIPNRLAVEDITSHDIFNNILDELDLFQRGLIDDKEHYPLHATYSEDNGNYNLKVQIDVGNRLLRVINEKNYTDIYNDIADGEDERFDSDIAEILATLKKDIEAEQERLREGTEALKSAKEKALDFLHDKVEEFEELLKELNKDREGNADAIQEVEYALQAIEDYVEDDTMDVTPIIELVNRVSALRMEQRRNAVEHDIAEATEKRKTKESPLDKDVLQVIKEAARTYYAHLNKQLRTLDVRINALSRKLSQGYSSLSEGERSKMTAEIKQLKEYYSKLKQLDLSRYNQDEKVGYFTFISREIDIIAEMMRNGRDMSHIFGRLDFLKKIITGVGLDNQKVLHPDFKTLAAANIHSVAILRTKLVKVENIFMDKMKDTLLKNLRNNVAAQHFMRSKGISEDNISQFLSYLIVKGDSSLFDIYLKGVGFSDADEGLMPQLLKAHFEQVRLTNTAEATRMKQELADAAKGISDFSFVFEKDSNGRKTGYIASIIRSSWTNLMKRINLLDDRKGASRNNTAFVRKHADVIDYAMLPEIHTIYGYRQEYSQYFVYSEEEMQAYKQSLQEKLGSHYSEVIRSIQEKLSSFDILSPSIGKNKANPTDNQFNPFNNIINFKAGEDISRFHYIEIIPKDEQYYNRDIEALSPQQRTYLNKLIDIYNDYISVHIPNYDSMSYGKIAVGVLDSLIKNKSGNRFKAMLKYAQGIFFTANKESVSEDALPAYVDVQRVNKDKIYNLLRNRSIDEIRRYAADSGVALSTLTTKKEELIEEFANAITISDFHTDINAITDTMLDLAAQTATRTEMLPIAQSYLLHFNKYNSDKKNAYKKMILFTNQVIKGLRAKDMEVFTRERGKIDISSIKTIDDMLVAIGKRRYLRQLSTADKAALDIIKRYANIDLKKKVVAFRYKDTDYFSINKGGHISMYKRDEEGRSVLIDDKEIEEAYARHIVEMVNNTGINMSIGSFMRGINTIVVVKYLGLNPVSGIINRWQGINDNSLADTSGYYWRTGNLAIADRFLMGINLIGAMGKRLIGGRVKQFQILRAMVSNMGVLQEHATAYDKNRRDSAKSLSKVLLNFAIDLPEFKNQMEIFLSILQDVTIKDREGKEHAFFTGRGFTAYDIIDGKLRLKEPFRTEDNIAMWEHFSTSNEGRNDMLLFMQKHTMAVSHIQNNFDKHDTVTTINNMLYSSMLTLKRWLISGWQQRFDSGRGYDLTTTKERKEGRLITALRHPASAISYALGSIALTMGIPTLSVPLAGLSVAGLGFALYKRLWRKSARTQVKMGIHSLSEVIGFMGTAIGNMVGMPLRLTLGKTIGMKWLDTFTYDQLRKLVDKEGNRKVSEEDIGNLKALAAELGQRAFFLAMSVGLLAMLYDDDDDKYAKRRRIYNYFANRLQSLVYDANIWIDPMKLTETGSRVPMLTIIKNFGETTAILAGIIDEEDEEVYGRKLRNALPIPNIVIDALSGGIPFQDDKVYNNTTIVRYSKHIATEGESTARSEYMLKRKNFIGYLANDKDIKDKHLRTKIANKVLGTKRGTYKESLQRLERRLDNKRLEQAVDRAILAEGKRHHRKRRQHKRYKDEYRELEEE